MRKLLPRLIVPAFAAPMIAALLAHAYVGLFSRYWYDDFSTAAILRDRGFVGSQLYWYMNWSGRFSFHLAVNLAELVGPWVVTFLPLAALSAWVAVTAWSAYQSASLLGLPQRGSVSLLSALLLVFATVNSTPDVVQSLYWQTGMLTYLAPLLLFTAYAGVVASSVRKGDEGMNWPRVILCALVTFIAGGFSEVSTVLQAGVMSLLLVATLTRARKFFGRGPRALVLAGFGGALAALLIVALAPGNKVRQAVGTPPAGWLWTAESSFRYALYFFEQHTRRQRGTALLTFALPAWLVLATHFALYRRSGSLPTTSAGTRGGLKRLAYGTTIGFGLIVLCFVPGFYAHSEALPARAQIIPKFILACTIIYWGALAGLALLRTSTFARRCALAAVTVATLILLIASPVAAAWRTFALGARASAYAAAWDESDRQIRAAAAAGLRDVTVRAIEAEERELGFGRAELRLGRDPKEPQNVAAAAYYGLDSIKAE